MSCGFCIVASCAPNPEAHDESAHYLVMADATLRILATPQTQSSLETRSDDGCLVNGKKGDRIDLAVEPVFDERSNHYKIRLQAPPCDLAKEDVYVSQDQILVTSDVFTCSAPPPLQRGETPEELYEQCREACFPDEVVTTHIDKKFCEKEGWGEAMADAKASPEGGRAFGSTDFTFDRLAGGHEGVDYSADEGEPVLTVHDGAVVGIIKDCNEKGNMCGNGYGNMVIIHHGEGMYSRYCHLHTVNVSPGQYVEKGNPIGGVGTTGWSDGNHLHVEIGTMAKTPSTCDGPYAFTYNYNYKWLWSAHREGPCE